MLNVATTSDLQGVNICFLLDITWANQTYRFSTFDVILSDGTKNYIYSNTLAVDGISSTLENSFDVDGDAIPVEVYFTDKDLVKEALQGNTLDYRECHLYYITVRNGSPLQQYNERIPVSRGRIIDPLFGDIDMPLGYVTFSIENGVEIDEYPLLVGKDIILSGQGKGKFRPLILGRPCGNIAIEEGSNISSFASSPAYFYTESGSDRIFIAAHPVESENVVIVDQDGTSVSKIVYNTGSFAYVSTAGLSVGDNSKTRIFTKWSTGGGLKNPSTGQSLQGVGDLLRYMLQYSNVDIDGDAVEGVREYLNTWTCDGWINEGIDAITFINNNIANLFPVSVSNGPRGIRPVLDLFNGIQQQNHVAAVHDGPDFLCVSGLVPMGSISDLCNNLILKCGYSAEKDGYLMAIEIDPRVDLQNTTAMRFSTVYGDASFNRYGLKTKIIESDIIGDYTTASSIAKDYVRRHAFLRIKIVVEAAVSWGWLELGDIIKITSTRLHLTGHFAQIITKSWTGASWTYELRIDDSSLNNSRPVDVVATQTTNNPVDSGGSYDTTNWYYIAGNSSTPNDPLYVPRVPFAAVDGINDPIFTFWNGGQEMISYKVPVSGSITVKFKMLRGGGGSAHATYDVKLANNFGSRVFHLAPYDWVTGKKVLIQKSSTGYTSTDTWSTIRTITRSEITTTGWTTITETFSCSNEYVCIRKDTTTGSGGWAIVDVEFIT